MNSGSMSFSNSFEILNFHSQQSHFFSKETPSKFIAGLTFHNPSSFFPDKPEEKPLKNPIPAKKPLKKPKRQAKFPCNFPYCHKWFVSPSQLQRHEASKIAHKRVISDIILSKCLNSTSVNELANDPLLKEVYKHDPTIFNKIKKQLKGKERNY